MRASLFLKQLFIAIPPQLASFATGGAITYPSILLQQLNSNNSSIHLDIESASWIGSIHGLTGIAAILMPTIMQWRGRKFAFLVASFISIIGWVLAFNASSVTTILISECCHGVGTNSLMTVSLMTLSELGAPKFRNISMTAIFVVQALGVSTAGLVAQYLEWKTISIVMGTPMVIAFLCALLWPESPFWLAYKGRYDECEETFMWLRGTDQNSMKELQQLIVAQKENRKNAQANIDLKRAWGTLKRRDFYIPTLFMFLLLTLMYCSGTLVFLIYGPELIYKATESQDLASLGYILINIMLFVGITSTNILIKYFNNKTLVLLSSLGTMVFLISLALVCILRDGGILSKNSQLFFYLVIGYMLSNSLGINSLVFTMSAELMPVKHRGMGGSFIIIYTCILHASSLKMAPYMFLYLGLPGTFFLYATNVIVCGLLIWRYVPETKGKTLQEIEDFYGDFKL